MTVRDQLVRDIEITDRLLEYRGYGDGLRRKLLDARAAMVRELATFDTPDEVDGPASRTTVIEFPGKKGIPRKAG